MKKAITEEQVKNFIFGMFLSPVIATALGIVVILCAKILVGFHNLIF